MLEKIIISPFQRFIKIESFSGILLFTTTVVALIWANSSLSHLYESFWNYEIGVHASNFTLVKPLILWVNDGLMVIFFFLIGLELKREFVIGELNTIRKASFPFFAAIGGMVIPVIMFIGLNETPKTIDGWGIPMAADIAFALAILKLVGKKVPISLKVFLTAYAIIDDIGAIIVIAIFYSSTLNWMLLLYALIPLFILYYLAYKRIYMKFLITIFGFIIWILFLKAGIHPTVAGVLLAFAVPIKQKLDISTYSNKIQDLANSLHMSSLGNKETLSKRHIKQLSVIETYTEKAQSPLQYNEHRLHNWVAYFIMPVFALANAGIIFSNNMVLDIPLVTNIVVCMVIGNFIGVTLMSYLSIKLKITMLPQGVRFRHILGIACLAGVGFTMSIFIANLAFVNNTEFIDSAKVGILIGSLISGVLGYIILKTTKEPNLR